MNRLKRTLKSFACVLLLILFLPVAIAAGCLLAWAFCSYPIITNLLLFTTIFWVCWLNSKTP